jgi:hypothetical protein
MLAEALGDSQERSKIEEKKKKKKKSGTKV